MSRITIGLGPDHGLVEVRQGGDHQVKRRYCSLKLRGSAVHAPAMCASTADVHASGKLVFGSWGNVSEPGTHSHRQVGQVGPGAPSDRLGFDGARWPAALLQKPGTEAVYWKPGTCQESGRSAGCAAPPGPGGVPAGSSAGPDSGGVAGKWRCNALKTCPLNFAQHQQRASWGSFKAV